MLLRNYTSRALVITILATPVTILATGDVVVADGSLDNVVQTAETLSLFQYGLIVPFNTDGSAYTGSIPSALRQVGVVPGQTNFPATGRALVADTSIASTVIGTSPAPWIWANVRNSLPDTHYSSATGVYTFTKPVFWFSNASWYIFGSSQRDFYADAETSTDGGATWVRGTNSMRVESAGTSGRTVQFPFNGFFPAGAMLRFVVWSSGSGVTVQTVAVSGSTAPASRLTLVTLDANKVTT